MCFVDKEFRDGCSSTFENMSIRVTIIGAGIIGLTTACTLLKEFEDFHQLQLTIIAEKFSPDTTGDISAGYWELYGVESTDERLLRWAKYTYDIFMSEFFSDKAKRAGLSQLTSFMIRKYSENESRPVFADLVQHFRQLNDEEMKYFQHFQTKIGFAMTSIAVEMKKYLPELTAFLQTDRRVKFVQRKLHSLDELKNRTDLIINCSGLAARSLVGDLNVRPARGQVIRIKAPWIKSAFSFDTNEGLGYILPQSDSVVLGGTFQLDNWNENIDDEDTKKILRMCRSCFPSLNDVHHGQIQVGLRPYRNGGVRLEDERMENGLNVIHCYGHSGSGVTMSWGCARDVVELAKKYLPSKENSKKNQRVEHEQLWRIVPKRDFIIIRANL